MKKAALPVTLAFWGLLNSAAYSQITPATRGTGTTIIQNGQNLFHLFREFNVGNGQILTFSRMCKCATFSLAVAILVTLVA
ncbi:MAG TPA: hypothetical protein IGP91_06360 [Thermosynechococcus sp. M46_R2017_013]|nr:hypothetical protein [Thermosynechococcus sp. M46_R2017_013]